MEKYTTEYLKNKANFEKLEVEFKNNPCSKTATKLAAARTILNNTQKHTQSFINYCDRENLKDLVSVLTFANPNDII